MIKILIADDQELIRESLKIILSTNNEFEVIDTVGSGKEVVESIRRHTGHYFNGCSYAGYGWCAMYQICQRSIS